jgi:hypothetical protein
MLIGSYPFRYRSRRDRRFSAATGQFSSNGLIDSRTRCSPALGLRTGKTTVRFTLAGPATFRCRTAAIFRPSMRYTAHIMGVLGTVSQGRLWPRKSLRLWIRRQIARLPRDLAAMALSQRELPARAAEGTKGSGPTYPVRVTRVRDDSR